MNRRFVFLIAASIVFAASAHAADGAGLPADTASPPAAETPSKAPSTPETKPDIKAESKPENISESNTEVKSEVKPDSKRVGKLETKGDEKPADAGLQPVPSKERALVAAPESKSVESPLNACAGKLKPVADSYIQAHDSLLIWLRVASGKMDASESKVGGLKKQIAEKEAQITQLKLESAKKNDAKARSLDQESRVLWTQLKSEESKRRDLCRALAAAAGQKVRDLNRVVLDQLEAAADSARSE